GSKAQIERIGGELKVNLWAGTIFTPYVTAGAGVMNIKYDTEQDKSYREEQLYGALGAGVKINFTKRAVLSLEGKNTLFNVNKNNRYLAAGANPDNTLQNWGAQASLDFYLGGRKQSGDQITRAYRALYSDGFRGMKFVLEPGIAYLDLHNKSIMQDQWFVGGSAGIDFTSLLGIRGFYYAATKDPLKLSLNLTDDVKMYGGNLIARLNQPRGVTPYLLLGGGYLDVNREKYIDINGKHEAKSGWFAMGGAGIEIPLGRHIALYGNFNAMLNEQENPDVKAVTEPSQVRVSMMYQTGLRFNFGSRSRGGEAMYRSYADRERQYERQANMEKLNEMRAKYDAQIAELNEELARAAEELDQERMAQIVEERKQIVEEKNEVVTKLKKEEDSAVREVQADVVAAPQGKTMVMTRSQLEELISRVVEKSQPKVEKTSDLGGMSDLDKILLFSVLGNNVYRQPMQQVQPVVQPQSMPNAELSRVLDKTEELVRKVDGLENKLNRAQEAALRQQMIESANRMNQQPIQIIETDQEGRSGKREVRVHTLDNNKEELITRSYQVSSDSYLKYSSVDVMTGLGIGDATTWNVAVRPSWQLGKSAFFFSPEFSYGFGDKTAWVATANLTYRFDFGANSKIAPYAGVGFGYSDINNNGRFGANVILGTSIKSVFGGRFFADYSLRPQFKNHQFSVGYSLKF
ncbi:MAG: outer membrane beta-barrel protein, partial [Porphyromonadaceae bacterium]|nr:outer membrane beta-barrel protein [Porphyromonadaceae bacterium]